MSEAWSANFALVRLIGAVSDEIDAEFTLGGLNRGVHFARRDVITLGIELEMMDQRFHGALHLAALGRNDLVVIDRDRPLPVCRAQPLDALLHDGGRLPHLLHANAVA